MSKVLSWLFRAIGWLFTVIFGLPSIVAFAEGHAIAAISFLVVTLLSCPPIWENEKYKRYAPAWGRVIVGVVAVTIGGATLPYVAEKVPSTEATPKASMPVAAKPKPAASPKKPTTSPTSQAERSVGPTTPGELPSNWEYSFRDGLDGTTRIASVVSADTLHFRWPYGPSHVRLQMEKRPSHVLKVMLVVNGQFVCNRYHNGNVAVQFDDGPVEHYPCSLASDGSLNVLFIKNESRFLAKLKKADHVFIEAMYFQEGRQQVLFFVNGLKWD